MAVSAELLRKGVRAVARMQTLVVTTMIIFQVWTFTMLALYYQDNNATWYQLSFGFLVLIFVIFIIAVRRWALARIFHEWSFRPDSCLPDEL